MWTLALASLRFRWLSFVGIFVTVMAATTLVTATGSLLEGGIRGAVPPERLVGADIVVAADQDISETRGRGDDKETFGGSVVERVRIPTDVTAQVESVAGVAGVVADVSFPAYVVVDGDQVAGPGGTPSTGHSWSSADATGFRLVHGDAPNDSDQVAIDSALAHRSGLGVGDRTTAVVSGRTVEVTVTGVADPSGGRPLTEQSAVFFSDAAAGSLYAHSDQADLLVVTVGKGADAATVATALDKVLDDQFVVLTGDERGRAEFLDSSESSIRLIAISGSLGGIALFVAALVLAGMITLFVQQRQREIALLRAIGATPRQVRRLLARETVMVTLLGALVGRLARVLARWTPGRGDAGQGSAPRDLRDRAGCLATGRRRGGGAGRQPDGRVRRGPQGRPRAARRGAHGVREARPRDRLAACARGTGVCCGYGRVVPRGDVGAGLDRAGTGSGDLDGRRGHRRALRTRAGVAGHSHRGRPSSGRSPVPVGSWRSPTCGRRSGAWHRR